MSTHTHTSAEACVFRRAQLAAISLCTMVGGGTPSAPRHSQLRKAAPPRPWEAALDMRMEQLPSPPTLAQT
eukprot:6400267-Alexandrium_andersonii.AAC.1